MSDTVARIEKLANGYEVEVSDPKQQKANQNPKTPWKDPWKCYAFSTKEEVIKFLTSVLDTLEPVDAEDEFGANFARAAKEED